MAGLLIVERFTLEHHVLYSIAYTVSNLRSWNEEHVHDQKLSARRVNTPSLMMF